MKVLHAAAFLENSSGIFNQMNWEQEAADRLGICWKVEIYTPKINLKKDETRKRWTIFEQALFSWRYHKWLTSVSSSYDLLLLRYRVFDPAQLWFLLTQRNRPVCLVHHTLELPELALDRTAKGRLKHALERLFGARAISRSAGTIGVTREIIEYEQSRSTISRRSYVYPNGIITGPDPIGDARGNVPEFLFVASHFYPWHGLELVLNELTRSNADVRIHLVGNLSSAQRALAEGDRRLILHGPRSAHEIRNIGEKCWVSLSSFALLSRLGMREASPLKVRESLLMGLPVFAGHGDVFPEGFAYFRHAPLTIADLVRYAHEVRGISRDQVARASRPYIDKSDLLKSLYGQLTLDFNCQR